MTGLLAPGCHCSAYWYAAARGLPVHLDYLRALGLTAARMAFWEGLKPWQVPEGPYLVYMWPERTWDAAADWLARYVPAAPDPPRGPVSRDPSCPRCNYDAHRCPGCGEPLPHGTEVCAGCDDAWGGRGLSASYQEWRDEGVYDGAEEIPPWCPLPREDQALRDIGY